jgi:hypothetical protein
VLFRVVLRRVRSRSSLLASGLLDLAVVLGVCSPPLLHVPCALRLCGCSANIYQQSAGCGLHPCEHLRVHVGPQLPAAPLLGVRPQELRVHQPRLARCHRRRTLPPVGLVRRGSCAVAMCSALLASFAGSLVLFSHTQVSLHKLHLSTGYPKVHKIGLGRGTDGRFGVGLVGVSPSNWGCGRR